MFEFVISAPVSAHWSVDPQTQGPHPRVSVSVSAITVRFGNPGGQTCAPAFTMHMVATLSGGTHAPAAHVALGWQSEVVCSTGTGLLVSAALAPHEAGVSPLTTFDTL